MPPVPYWAEKPEELILTSPMVSKIGVLITLSLIGELTCAPSSIAVEKGRLPLTAADPMPGLALLPPFPETPGCSTTNDCQSGVPEVSGRACRVWLGNVSDSSEDVVWRTGAFSLTTTCCVVCPTVNCTFKPTWPTCRIMGPRCRVANPALVKVTW